MGESVFTTCNETNRLEKSSICESFGYRFGRVYRLSSGESSCGRGPYCLCVDNGIRGEYDHLYRELIARSSVTDFRWDLTDTSSVAQLPLDVESIFHLAAFNGTQNFYDRPLEVVRCCTLPTLNLLQHYGGGAGHVEQFIYASSSEVYASTVTRFNWPVPTAGRAIEHR